MDDVKNFIYKFKDVEGQTIKNKDAKDVDNNYLCKVLWDSDFGSAECFAIMKALKKSKNVNLVYRRDAE